MSDPRNQVTTTRRVGGDIGKIMYTFDAGMSGELVSIAGDTYYVRFEKLPEAIPFIREELAFSEQAERFARDYAPAQQLAAAQERIAALESVLRELVEREPDTESAEVSLRPINEWAWRKAKALLEGGQ